MILKFSLVSPEKVILKQDVSQVVVPGLEGDIGVLPQHAPLLTLLRPGVIYVYDGIKVIFKLFVDGGFCQILPEKCTALITNSTPLESLNKQTLELEIRNLIEEKDGSRTSEELKKADQNLKIARSKLMELMSYQKMT